MKQKLYCEYYYIICKSYNKLYYKYINISINHINIYKTLLLI